MAPDAEKGTYRVLDGVLDIYIEALESGNETIISDDDTLLDLLHALTELRDRRAAGPAKLAARLLADHAPGRFPVPVEDIAKALGVEVVTKRHDGPESSFALRDGGTLIVGVNSNTSPRRQRVATAHALGHLLMHERPIIVCNAVRLPRPGVASRGSDEEESQANAFAADLLMPPEVVAAAFAARDDGQAEALFPRDRVTDELARQFDVGSELVHYRLVSLGLLAS